MKSTGKRRAPRVPLQASATLSGRQTRAVTVVDLSSTGCLVRSEADLDAGSILDLDLPLAALHLRAKVRVIEASVDGESMPSGDTRYLVGLEFLGLQAKDETALRHFLEAERRRRREDPAAR